jgi:hypothetical protein
MVGELVEEIRAAIAEIPDHIWDMYW